MKKSYPIGKQAMAIKQNIKTSDVLMFNLFLDFADLNV